MRRLRGRFLFLVPLIVLALHTPTVMAQGPMLMVTSPANGATIQGSSVTVNFQAMGFNIVPSSVPLSEAGKHTEANHPGEGHVHIMLDLQPFVVWYKSDPYTFNNVPPGEHQLMVELVNNDHSSFSPPIVQNIRFRTEGPASPFYTPSGPQLTIASPANGATITGSNATVSFQVTGLNIVPSTVPLTEAGKHPEANHPGEGHLHFMLDLQPLAVWYKTDPYTFNNLAPGEHQLMVELVNNDHSSFSPPIVEMIHFRTAASDAQAASSSSPQLTITSPPNGAQIDNTDLTVNFQVTGMNVVPSSVPLNEAGKHPEANHPGEGHLHFMLDLQPLAVWYKTDPYTFNNLAPGEHQLMVELVNNDHSSLTPPVTQIIRFQVAAALPVTGEGHVGRDSRGSLIIVLELVGFLLIVLGGFIWRASLWN